MSDWAPIFVGVVLFILVTPGLLFQIPGPSKYYAFGTFQTSGLSILVHTIIYSSLMCIFLLVLRLHVYIG